MLEPRVLGGFVLRFMLIFTVAILPWKPLVSFTRIVFLAEAQVLLSLALPQMKVQAELFQDPRHESIDSRISLRDPRNTQADGRVPTSVMTLDSRSLSWMPHAVWFALCGATPVSWKRRIRMLLTGLLALQVFVGCTVLTMVYSGLAQDSTPAWEVHGLDAINRVLVDNLWVSFVVPWLVWIIWISLQNPWPFASRNQRE
jgi:hypothetical protein